MLRVIRSFLCMWVGYYKLFFLVYDFPAALLLFLFTCLNVHNLRKLAASSMLHEAKIAYYAFDVIRFFVPYRVAAHTCCAVNVLTSRIPFFSPDLGGWGPSSSIIC